MGDVKLSTEQAKLETQPTIIEKVTRKSSLSKASLTLFKSFIGTGILALPHSFKDAGLGLSIISTILIGLLSYYTMRLIVRVADHMEKDEVSFNYIAKSVLGSWGSYITTFSILAMQIACCISYLIFIIKFLNFVSCEFMISWACNTTWFYVLIIFLVIFPLTLINSIHWFYIPSLLANLFVILAVFSQIFYDASVLARNPELKRAGLKMFREFYFTKIPLFFGVVVFSFEGIGMIFTIRSSLKKPQHFSVLLKGVMTAVTTVYILFATISYMTFQENTREIIFFNLPVGNAAFLILEVLYSFALIFSFPVQLFPAIKIVEHSKYIRKQLYSTGGKVNKAKRYLIRLIFVTSIFAIASSIPSFALFINLIGALVFSLISFVIPIIIYNKYFRNTISTKKLIANWLVLIIGVVGGIFGAVITIMQMVNQSNDKSGSDYQK